VNKNGKHYDLIPSGTGQSESGQKQAKLNKKVFLRKLGNWIYALAFALLPSILIFFLHTGPPKEFYFLVFFSDNALFYVCVSISAVALCTYRLKSGVRFLHTLILAIGMAIYVLLSIEAPEAPVALFKIGEYIKERTAFVLLGFSIVLGITTLFNSSIKREK
jgi:hypothetical protein